MNSRSTSKLRFRDVFNQLSAVGISITKDTVGSGPTGSGEYRVAYSLLARRWPGLTKAKAEKSAAYTPDLDDALHTGLAMAKRGFWPGTTIRL